MYVAPNDQDRSLILKVFPCIKLVAEVAHKPSCVFMLFGKTVLNRDFPEARGISYP